MNLIGLDMNASLAHAVSGPADGLPRSLPLGGGPAELPVALSLEKRKPEVGAAALRLCRRSPHLACRGFLPYLGTDRQWSAGRHRLDAARATAMVLDEIRPACKGAAGAVLSVPGYLTADQTTRLRTLAEKAKLPVTAVVSAPLVLAWAACMEDSWSDVAMLADVDEHALTWTAFTVNDDQVSVVGQRTVPQLGLAAWINRLIDGLAERCVRQSRRDPRDSADAEQMLYEQLPSACEACREGRLVELACESEHWFQNLILRPEEFLHLAAPLVRQAVEERLVLDQELSVHEPARAVWLSAAAGRLPGLAEVLQGVGVRPLAVNRLGSDAAARAAHELAASVQRRELAGGTFDLALPLFRSRTESDTLPLIDPLLRSRI